MTPHQSLAPAQPRRFGLGGPLRAALWLGLLGLLATTAARAARFDIPAQPAPAALRLFIRQSGVGVLFIYDDLKAVRTNEVRGEMAPAAALKTLLAGTGFAASRNADGNFVVAREAADPPGSVGGVLIAPAGSGSSVADITATVLETGRSGQTDRDGRFEISGLPPGTYTIEITGEGFSKLKITDVVVRSGTATNLGLEEMPIVMKGGEVQTMEEVVVKANRETTDEVVNLEEVLVTASPYSLTPDNAVDQQHQAPSMIVVRSAQDIEESPAKFIGDALDQISGVAVHRDFGEVTYARVEGLDQNLSSTTFDGMRLLPGGTNNDAGVDNAGGVTSGESQRAVNFGILPTNVAGNIELNRTITPDMDAEAIGGNLNLVPKSGFNYAGRYASIVAETGYLFQSERPNYRTELEYADTFALRDGVELAAYLSGVWFENNRSIDLIATQPTLEDIPASSAFIDYPSTSRDSITYRKYGDKQKAYGGTVNLDLKVRDDARYFLYFYVDGFNEKTDREALAFADLDSDQVDAAGAYVAPASAVSKQLRETISKPQTINLVSGGQNKLGDCVLDYKFGYNEFKEDDTVTTPSFALSSDIAAVYDGYAEFPSVTQTGGPDIAAAANYKLSKVTYTGDGTEDSQASSVASLTIPLDWDDTTGFLKFGDGMAFRQKTYSETSGSYTLGSKPLLSAYESEDGLADYDGTSAYLGHYNLGPDIDYDNLMAFLNGGGGALNAPYDPLASFAADEDILALYGLYNVRLAHLTIIAGVRGELTDDRYRANEEITVTGSSSVVSPVAVDRDYVNLFPNLQFKYDFRPNLVGRLSYTTAIARPTFDEIVPFVNETVDLPTTTIDEGNPNLRPTTSNNFDASLESYHANGSLLSVGVFDKQMTNYIVPVFDYYPATASELETYTNVSRARIYGTELAYRQQFDGLPGFASGFGLQGNITLVNSQGRVHGPGYPSGSLPEVSAVTYSVGAFYQKHRLSLHVDAAFTGDFLEQINTGQPAYDIYDANAIYLSAYCGYNLTRHLKIYLDGANLNDQPRTRLFGNRTDDIYDSQYFGATMNGGVKVTF